MRRLFGFENLLNFSMAVMVARLCTSATLFINLQEEASRLLQRLLVWSEWGYIIALRASYLSSSDDSKFTRSV